MKSKPPRLDNSAIRQVRKVGGHLIRSTTGRWFGRLGNKTARGKTELAVAQQLLNIKQAK